MPKAATAIAMRFITALLLEICSEKRNGSIAPLMRERPEPQLLLGDLPQPGQAVRLDDQEEDDQAAEDDGLGVGHERVRYLYPQRGLQRLGGQVQQDREEGNEGRSQEGAEDRAHAADDHHEEDAE